ncbi:MAG: hydrogenase maturation protease [Deltaproteobacteria bacterium]
MEKPQKTLVLGIGNILLTDEGLGVRAVEFFRANYSFPSYVRCIDGGTAGLGLLPAIKGFKRLIIVDAMRARRGPGAILKFSWPIKGNGRLYAGTTAHSIGIPELLRVMDFEGLRPLSIILGMVPRWIAPGSTLSPEVMERLPMLAKRIASELKGFSIPVKKIRVCAG